MKKTLAIICAAIALASCTNDCIIDGSHQALVGNGRIYMYDEWNDHQVIDSSQYANGHYHFKTDASLPTLVSLYTDTQIKLHEFILEPGKIDLTTPGGVIRNLVVGTPMNDAFSELTVSLNTLSKDPSALNESFEAGAEIIREAIAEGNGNAFSMMVMEQAISGLHPLELLGYFDTLEDYLKAKPFALKMKAELEKRAPVHPYIEGSGIEPHYIDIIHPGKDNRNISLKEVVENPDNRYVLVDFWATWCGPCRMYLPSLKGSYELYHDKGLEIYSVSCDENAEQWKKFIDDEDMEWTNVIGGIELPEADSYQIYSIPTTILIDCSNGFIVGRDLHGDMLQKRLEELMK
ncbi:MAG: AhpC/TSA family protein [Bacteroidales bacterium]|nr:AhpC/TSA family protein [Bacteroidales bacterium]